MALDKNGVPIPVYVPPPAPPLGANPPDHLNPQVENDIALLKSEATHLFNRLAQLEDLGAGLGRLHARIEAVEASLGSIAQTLTKFGVVEEAFAKLPKLVDQITLLAGDVARNDETISMTRRQLDELEKRVHEAWEHGHVHPVSTA